jgi:hypothetical protein
MFLIFEAFLSGEILPSILCRFVVPDSSVRDKGGGSGRRRSGGVVYSQRLMAVINHKRSFECADSLTSKSNQAVDR